MIAIVIPTLNEAKNLKHLIPAIYQSVRNDYITVIVDDNSKEMLDKI